MIKFLKKLLGIHSPTKEWPKVTDEYHEEDTECDKCEFRDQCNLIESTSIYDTGRHFIPWIDNACKKEEA